MKVAFEVKGVRIHALAEQVVNRTQPTSMVLKILFYTVNRFTERDALQAYKEQYPCLEAFDKLWKPTAKHYVDKKDIQTWTGVPGRCPFKHHKNGPRTYWYFYCCEVGLHDV